MEMDFMNTQKIKTKLIGIFGEKPVAFLQAIRFASVIAKHNPDPEVALLPALLRQGDTAIDVGANGANWTYWLHRHVGDSGTVFAFEADPYYALATEIAIKLMRLRGVRLFQFGLSEVDEEAPLVVSDADGLRMSGLVHIDKNAKETNGRQMVKLRSLDSLIQDYPKIASVNLIKCDVEGYELFVFRGAVKTLELSRPIIILEVGHYEMQGYSSRDVFEFFAARNYEAFAKVNENTVAKTNPMLEREGALSVNRLMIPKEKIASFANAIRFDN
jgi:FkbM family methyltransferase